MQNTVFLVDTLIFYLNMDKNASRTIYFSFMHCILLFILVVLLLEQAVFCWIGMMEIGILYLFPLGGWVLIC